MHVLTGKSIIVTGAANGFGRLISEKAAALSAKVTCSDVDVAALDGAVAAIGAGGGEAQAVIADVRAIDDMRTLATRAVEAYGAIDVLINNAGVMPLGFFASHEAAIDKWHRCIDINVKGVLNGMVSVYDQMMAQGRGHIVNISSIYGNFPVAGGGVYGATKSAVNFMSEALRVESRGVIKVTTIKPTGVPGTNLSAGVVDAGAIMGSVGRNTEAFGDVLRRMQAGDLTTDEASADHPAYAALDPADIADQVIYAISQPAGVSVSDITVRATGDYYIF